MWKCRRSSDLVSWVNGSGSSGGGVRRETFELVSAGFTRMRFQRFSACSEYSLRTRLCQNTTSHLALLEVPRLPSSSSTACLGHPCEHWLPGSCTELRGEYAIPKVFNPRLTSEEYAQRQHSRSWVGRPQAQYRPSRPCTRSDMKNSPCLSARRALELEM